MNLKKYIIILISILGIIIFLYLENNLISVNKINVNSKALPVDFNGYRIVHLSDLHNKNFGKSGKKLLNKVKHLKPDIIVITGDLVDVKKYNEENSLEVMRGLVNIASVYFVTGNHEWWSENFNTLEIKLQEVGVNILRNESEKLVKENANILILGVDDPEGEPLESSMKKAFKGINENNKFKILLSHRPEYINMYSKYNVDLVLCGHAHGGQVRLPFIGGIVSPNQGFLPKYTSGEYTLKDTKMIVSRGLGNSIIPQRLFNRPEIILVSLWNK